MEAQKTQFINEFKANYDTMTKNQLLVWVGNRVMTLVNFILNQLEPVAFDLTKEYTEEEKTQLKSILGESFDVEVLRERAYGYNTLRDKWVQLKTTFMNS
jgi:hypothetical protein